MYVCMSVSLLLMPLYESLNVFPGSSCSVHQRGELQWPWGPARPRPLPGAQWVHLPMLDLDWQLLTSHFSLWFLFEFECRRSYQIHLCYVFLAINLFLISFLTFPLLRWCPVVFMGSEKYPAENGFDAFLKKHGGSDNASTDCERTIFQFDVQKKYFREALDRWGWIWRRWPQTLMFDHTRQKCITIVQKLWHRSSRPRRGLMVTHRPCCFRSATW